MVSPARFPAGVPYGEPSYFGVMRGRRARSGSAGARRPAAGNVCISWFCQIARYSGLHASSFDGGGFTLNWTTNDTAATQLLYLALALAPTPTPRAGAQPSASPCPRDAGGLTHDPIAEAAAAESNGGGM